MRIVKDILRGIASFHLFPEPLDLPNSIEEAFRKDMEALRGDWGRAVERAVGPTTKPKEGATDE